MTFRTVLRCIALGTIIGAGVTAFRPAKEVEIRTSASVNVKRFVKLHVSPQVERLSEPRSHAFERHGPPAKPRLVLRATGYNSLESQTDDTPFITAIGSQTRPGIVAISRDLLAGQVPYGSLVRLRDLGGYYGGGYGKFQEMLDAQGLFVVEDTLHQRKTQQVDVWFESYYDALDWGIRKVELELVRHGWDGPVLDHPEVAEIAVVPVLRSPSAGQSVSVLRSDNSVTGF